MSRIAKAYIAVVTLAGAIVLFAAAAQWRSENLLRFGFYFLFAVLAAQLKVALPGITGTMSVNYIFTLVSITSLNVSQAIFIGCAGTLAQCLWRAKVRPKPIQLVFNTASASISAAVCFLIFHSPFLRHLNSALPMMLFWTTSSYFLVNTCCVAGVIALTEGKQLWRVWYEGFLWTAPQYLVGATLAWILDLGSRRFGWEAAVVIVPLIYLVDYSYRLYLTRLEQEKKHVDTVADLHLRTIKTLALAIDAKDETTHNHLRRVQVYATEIAKEMGVSEPELRALQAAALLHDIGKLAVPEYIISKPGKLTPEEFEKMKIHPIVGAEILESVDFPYPVVPIVRSHHEKWNGLGYPDGLQGEEIPVGARILAAVDCLDALASDRHYRRALPLKEAMERVKRESGKSFDPRVVEILARRHVELEQMAKATPVTKSKLSIDAKVTRGGSPAAGFETAPLSCEIRDEAPSADFISSIAAARQEFQMLLEITTDLGNSLRLDETFSLLAARLKPMIPYDTIVIYVRKDSKLTAQYAAGEDSGLFASLEIPMGQGLSGWVAKNKRPILNGDPSVEAGGLNKTGPFSNLRSAIAIPLEGISGVVGTLALLHKKNNAFNKDHLRILMAISSKAGLTIENAMQFRQAQKSAFTDELTGLPNARSLFLQLDTELARAQRAHTPLAVLVLDLDGFKQVNDRFGHMQGNRLLKLIASNLTSSCREFDYVARMGGDEFVVILRDARPETISRKRETFRELVASAGQSVDPAIRVTLSVGEAFFPVDGTDVEQLLAKADRRMYRAKQAHHVMSRSALGFHDPPVGAALVQ